MDFFEVIARRKLNAPPEWKWCRLEWIEPDAMLVTGGVPRIYVRGPRKGQPKWGGVTREQCVVTEAERRAEWASYEASTGLCYNCCGEARTLYRWSKDSGTEYRECRRCTGTGKAPAASISDVEPSSLAKAEVSKPA